MTQPHAPGSADLMPETPDPDTIILAADGWVDIDPTVCHETLMVDVGGGAWYELHCEDDAGHEPPCEGTLRWSPITPPTKGDGG